MQVQVNMRQLFYSYKLLHGMLHVSLMLSKGKDCVAAKKHSRLPALHKKHNIRHIHCCIT